MANIIRLNIKIPKGFLSKRLKNFDGKITRNLRKQMVVALKEIRSSIASEAPGNMSNRIMSLPIENSRSSKFRLMLGKGKLEASIVIARKRDMVILYLDRGTGIYGPKRRLIRPIKSRFLVFEVNGRLIFTKSVKCIKPMRFIKRGISNSKSKVTKIISKALK